MRGEGSAPSGFGAVCADMKLFRKLAKLPPLLGCIQRKTVYD